MTKQDFTTGIMVDHTPAEVYNAINNVRGWWSENIDGSTDTLNSEFLYHYKDVHRCKIRITELIPSQRVVWYIADNYFNFTKDNTEWKDTRIVFDIKAKDGKTEMRFTHEGLAPQYECFDVCKTAWTHYIQDSLRGLITESKGQPSPKDEHEESFNSQLVDKMNQ